MDPEISELGDQQGQEQQDPEAEDRTQPQQREDSDDGEEENEDEYQDAGDSDSHGEYGPLDKLLNSDEDDFPPAEEVELVSYSQADFELAGEEIGTGQLGTVYKMVYKPTNAPVAAKKIRIRSAADHELLRTNLETLAHCRHELSQTIQI